MNGIIGNATIGLVIVFCVVVSALIFWPENGLRPGSKRRNKVDSPVKNDAPTEDIEGIDE